LNFKSLKKPVHIETLRKSEPVDFFLQSFSRPAEENSKFKTFSGQGSFSEQAFNFVSENCLTIQTYEALEADGDLSPLAGHSYKQ
jgi:hypothetical protein